ILLGPFEIAAHNISDTLDRGIRQIAQAGPAYAPPEEIIERKDHLVMNRVGNFGIQPLLIGYHLLPIALIPVRPAQDFRKQRAVPSNEVFELIIGIHAHPRPGLHQIAAEVAKFPSWKRYQRPVGWRGPA